MCSCRHKCARSGVTIIPSSRSALNAPHGNTGQQGDACDGERGAYSRCDWGGKNTMVRFDAQGCPEDCIGRETWNLWAPPRPAPPSEQSPSFSRLTRRRRGARRWALKGPRARTRATYGAYPGSFVSTPLPKVLFLARI